MNDDRNLERRIGAVYTAAAPHREPAGLLDDILLTTGRTRQRRSWLALIKEPPMRSNDTVAVGSPTARIAGIVVATLLAAAMIVGAGIIGSRLLAAGNVIIVAQDGSGTVTSVTEAVAMAGSGDIVRIRPGTYDESVTVDKDLVLEGDGAVEDIVLTVEEGPILTLTDADTRLSGLTFSGPESDGVRVSGGSSVIEGVAFRDVGHPFISSPCLEPCFSLALLDGAQATVRDNVLTGGGQIRADAGAAVTIEGNELVDGPHLAIFDVAGGSVLRDNTVRGARTRAIGFYRPTETLVQHNTVEDSGTWGITVGWDQNGSGIDPFVIDNTVVGSPVGIYVAPDSKAMVEDNVLTDNGTGISVVGSSATIDANTISGGQLGMWFQGGVCVVATDNVISDADEAAFRLTSGSAPVISGGTYEEDPSVVDRDDGSHVATPAEAAQLCADPSTS